MRWTIHEGDATRVLPSIERGSVDCVVTSPPYWGLRSYGVAPTDWPEVSYAPMPGLPPVVEPPGRECLGLEFTPSRYVAHLVHVFREVAAVLAPRGTAWLNLGDTYVAGRNGGIGASSVTSQRNQIAAREAWVASGGASHRRVRGLAPKSLVGVPWRVAFALQADGWILRSDVVWRNPCPQPESVRDRPTGEHEYVFLLARSRHYHYDADAISEPISGDEVERRERERRKGATKVRVYTTRNRRSVWTIAHERKGPGEEHTAPFPETLVDVCVRAGCPPGGLVLDPFCGRGTAGAVSLRLGRRFVGIEASDVHAARARSVCVAELARIGEATVADAARVPGDAVQLGLLRSG